MNNGNIKRITVNRHIIKHNAAFPNDVHPPFSIQTSDGMTGAMQIDILGRSTLYYQPEHPLKCGAKVWIETNAPLILNGVDWEHNDA